MPVVGPISVRWVAVHTEYDPGRSFRDVQVGGPFRRWDHVHTVEPVGPRASELEDRVSYELRLGWAGRAIAGGAIRRELERTFCYRHRTTALDLALHAERSRRPLTVAVSVPDGLVGRALCALLATGGHRVLRLVRHARGEDEISWGPGAGASAVERLEPADAIVCLRPEGVATRRRTPRRRAQFVRGELVSTRALAEAAAQHRQSLQAFVSVSSMGFYGPQGYRRLDDEAAVGAGLWSEVCREHEAAAAPAQAAGVRVVHLRTGCVLSSAGGALERMLPAFRLGLGPVLGSGRNFLPWISLDDLVGVILWAITGDELDGPVNAVAPEALTQRQITATLARVLGCPPGVTVPRGLVGALLGREVLLASVRAVPEKLTRAGYRFRDPTLEGALRHTLGAWWGDDAEQH
jgi:uncharacterized protein (TIGR01777 family)